MLKLSNFEMIRPIHETDQQTLLEWFVAAHAQAESKKEIKDPLFTEEAFKEKLLRVGCKPDRIAKRGHTVPDYLHKEWEKMEIYNLKAHPSGYDLSVRSCHFAKQIDRVFEEYYPKEATAPNDLIHVSCTGYLSPSGAQKIASKRNWGHQTTITHAYHMGCYGSIPAIRMAGGFLAYDTDKTRADIVHTELCSIHTDPANHSLGALVAQSLFADGFIKYSASKQTQEPHFRVVAIQEEIIPHSIEAMTWDVAHWGFEIFLSKEVPVFITRALLPFLERLSKRAGMDKERLLKSAHFAIHPGGPKILLQVQKTLELLDAQMQESFTILKQYGNMSSATLPHIWKALLEDRNVPHENLVVSLAFGPGLSITGSIMEKICGS